MISEEIMEELAGFTDEEIDNLNGKNVIDRSIFLNSFSNTIDYRKMLTENQQISVRKHVRFIEYPEHRHNYLELMYVYSGKMIHVIDGNEIMISEGELLLLNQNIAHSIKFAGEDDIIFNFIIPPNFLDFLSAMLEEDNQVVHFIFDALYSYGNDGEYLKFKVTDDDEIKTQIETIITAIYRPNLNNHLSLKLQVGLLLVRLMNAPEKIETYSINSHDRLLSSSILKYIALNYEKGSLQELSQELHLPDYKICKIIKKMTGSTFKQLVQEIRLEKAAELLRTTNLPVYEILSKIGYENITFFYKIFKNKYGLTPNEFRKMQNRLV